MRWGRFCFVLAVGIGLVMLQGVAAWFDGYLTQAQMQMRGISNGWSFFEHGGMWGDFFVITPLLAYVLARFEIPYGSMTGLTAVALSLLACSVMGYQYQLASIVAPEAHAHHGRTTVAGFIHGAYAAFAICTIALLYIGMHSPSITREQLLAISVVLTPFFFLGVAKLSEQWSFAPTLRVQVAVEIAAVWGVTLLRLLSGYRIGEPEVSRK